MFLQPVTVAQLTFWTVTGAGSVGMTLLFFPGVAKHAASRRDAFIAAAMTAVLFAIPLGMLAGALVNGLF